MKATSKESIRKHSEDLSVCHIFERQAALTPCAVAVVGENDQLTYGELNRRANHLAHYLRALGVKSETPVGVYIEQSPEMLIGLLGILKAGGAYVPLDVSYPQGRKSLIIEDSGLTLLLTSSGLWSAAPISGAQPVYLDANNSGVEATPDTDLARTGSAEMLAYIIYTSGSTGQPKGVEIRNRAVVSLLESMRHEPGVTSADRFLAVTTLSFDISVLELFLPLTVGGCLILGNTSTRDPLKLVDQLIRENVTIMQATPTMWQYLLDVNWTGKADLTVLCGGEAFPRPLAPQLFSRSAAVWNMYGPTETTIWSSTYRVAGEQEGAVPIGGPIAGTQMQLLDEKLQPIGGDDSGLLYIGGEGLARGYHRQPDLTAERFVPDPFSAAPGARIYNTGDVAFRYSDGAIGYLGRQDFQVKLRGVRIELGEIEAVVELHPGVRQAVAIVREDVPGDKRIIVYYVPATTANLTANELRRHLSLTIPEHMLPSKYVRMNAFPLTSSGKIDRRLLPAPPMSRARVGEEFVPPQTQFEKEVTEIWSSLLALDEISMHDHFLELGGHSLLVMQVISRLEDTFRVRLSISDVLTKGMTVKGLVALIEDALFRLAQLDDFNALIQELENLSEDEARARLL